MCLFGGVWRESDKENGEKVKRKNFLSVFGWMRRKKKK